MYTLIHNTCSYSFPIRVNAYFIYTFEGGNPQKSETLLHITISNDCIYACLEMRSLVNLLVFPRFKKYIILDLYNDPLYLAPLRSLLGPFILFDIIELHAFYVGHH